MQNWQTNLVSRMWAGELSFSLSLWSNNSSPVICLTWTMYLIITVSQCSIYVLSQLRPSYSGIWFCDQYLLGGFSFSYFIIGGVSFNDVFPHHWNCCATVAEIMEIELGSDYMITQYWQHCATNTRCVSKQFYNTTQHNMTVVQQLQAIWKPAFTR